MGVCFNTTAFKETGFSWRLETGKVDCSERAVQGRFRQEVVRYRKDTLSKLLFL